MTSVADVIEAVLGAKGLECEAVKPAKAGGRTIWRVTIDGDGASGHGLTLDEVAEASQAISAALDETDVMGDAPYVLEVSTRGVDAPLTKPAHWRRNTGRLVSVTGRDGTSRTGRIESADETGAGLAGGVRVTYADVVKAVVQVEMNRAQDEDEES